MRCPQEAGTRTHQPGAPAKPCEAAQDPTGALPPGTLQQGPAGSPRRPQSTARAARAAPRPADSLPRTPTTPPETAAPLSETTLTLPETAPALPETHPPSLRSQEIENPSEIAQPKADTNHKRETER